jgi:hypothetical protein
VYLLLGNAAFLIPAVIIILSVRGIEEKEALQGRDWKGIYYCRTEGRF